MANNKDLFAPPKEEELDDIFAPPSPEELDVALAVKKAAPEEVSKFETATTAIAKSLPFIGSWTDEAVAGALAAKEAVESGDYSQKSFKKNYDRFKKAATDVERQKLEANPKTALFAGIGGALLAPIPGVGKAKAVKQLAALAAEGGVSAAGRDEDILTGAGIGAGAGLLARAIPTKTIKKIAEKKALRGAGITPTKLERVSSRYGKQIEESIADVIRDKKLMSGMTPDKAYSKATELVNKTGKDIGDVLGDLQKSNVPVKMDEALTDIQQILLGKPQFADPSKIADKAILAEYKKFNEEILPELYNNVKSASWQDFKNMREYLIDQLKTPGDVLPATRKVYKEAIVAVDDVITQQLKQISPDLGDKYRRLKTEYGALKTIQEGLSKTKGESPLSMIKRGRIVEGVGKAAAAPIVGAAERAFVYKAPQSAEGLATLVQRGQRIRSQQPKKKEK